MTARSYVYLPRSTTRRVSGLCAFGTNKMKPGTIRIWRDDVLIYQCAVPAQCAFAWSAVTVIDGHVRVEHRGCRVHLHQWPGLATHIVMEEA